MLSFVSGIFIQLDTPPSGIGVSGSDVAALVVWGLGGIWVATRRFVWEPQGRSAE